MISKKLRFEVFKRDSFTCQYCGRTPPEVTLEADHIIPKKEKGIDDIVNLITACFDCNRGKGKRNLNTIPKSINNNFNAFKEKQWQLAQYTKFLRKQTASLSYKINLVNEEFRKYFGGYELNKQFKTTTLKTFVTKLPHIKVIDAMFIACNKYKVLSTAASYTKIYWGHKAISYFCGICWNWIKRPETRDW